jgi:hypothetical protein
MTDTKTCHGTGPIVTVLEREVSIGTRNDHLRHIEGSNDVQVLFAPERDWRRH